VFLQVFLVGGGNEALGWREFALPRLQRSYSAFTASLLIGVCWFAWHLPLFLVAGSSQAGVPVAYYGIAVIALSVVFTWLYNETGGSDLLTMLLHAPVNTGGNPVSRRRRCAPDRPAERALCRRVPRHRAGLPRTYGSTRLAHVDAPTRPAGSQR
jgi:membrane protease YdiL (CAAX protease family)